MSEKSGLNRRHFLAVATSVTGAAGLVMTAVPFVMSFKPNARAQALGAPVEIDISKLEEGAMVRVMWRGKPVWVLRRSKEMLERMAASQAPLRDRDSETEQQTALCAERDALNRARDTGSSRCLYTLGMRSDRKIRDRTGRPWL